MDNGTVPSFKGQITLGNIISWVVMVATMAMVYGSMAQTVRQNSVTNDRQDALLTTLRESIGDLKVAIAEANGELKLQRQLMERVYSEQRAAKERP